MRMETWWLLWFMVLLIGFVILERLAFKKNETTLSRFIVNITAAWPLFPFIFGLIVGGLGVHFFWSWCPLLGIGNG